MTAKPKKVDPHKYFVDKNYDPLNDPHKDTHYPPATQNGNRFPISGKSGGRPPGRRTDEVKKRKLQLMLTVSAEDMSTDPLPMNNEGLPSFDKVLAEYCQSDEGRQLIRMAARALVVKASTGDNPAMFELAKRLDGQAKIKNEITAKIDRNSEKMDDFTPEELEEFIRSANRKDGTVIDATPERVEYLTHETDEEPQQADSQESQLIEVTTDEEMSELMSATDE